MFYKVIANTTCYLLWQISLAESGCIVWEAHPLLTRLILQLPHMFTIVGFSVSNFRDFLSKLGRREIFYAPYGRPLAKEGPVTKDNIKPQATSMWKIFSQGSASPSRLVWSGQSLSTLYRLWATPMGRSPWLVLQPPGHVLFYSGIRVASGGLSRLEGGDPQLRSVQPLRDHPQPPSVLREQE